jgi:UDP-N-acetylmuramoylalanine--D-glutamate ligase
MEIAGKKTVVLGLGHSGEAAADLLLREGGRVTVCESADSPALREKAAALRARGVRVLLGSAADSDSEIHDLAVISPGIDPVVPLVRNVVSKNIPMIGELELAFAKCSCPVVAITGTNGKTTTTELTTRVLQGCGLRAMASGNIGLPFAEAVQRSGEMDVMVLEVSSFQLETIRDFRPKVAAWLNLSPNHLDRYPGMVEYRAAKLRIFENQTSEDFAVVNAVNDLPMLRARTSTFSASSERSDFTRRENSIFFHSEKVLDQADTRLPGVHNAENIMAALGIGQALGLEMHAMAKVIPDYTPPAHRCEFVREVNGVRWVNDSKSTNLDAMAQALRSQAAPVILIAGGKDKGTEFDDNAALVQEGVRAAVLIGEMRHRIAKSWSRTECRPVDSLEDAVSTAWSLARPGDVILFSPGTSSFDMFRNYGERGNLFKSLVHQLETTTTP